MFHLINPWAKPGVEILKRVASADRECINLRIEHFATFIISIKEDRRCYMHLNASRVSKAVFSLCIFPFLTVTSNFYFYRTTPYTCHNVRCEVFVKLVLSTYQH